MKSNNLIETQSSTTKLDRTLRCIKYEIKLLKKRPINVDNSISAKVEEHSNETPIYHIDDLDTVNNNVYELEEVLRCMKHKIKQLKSTVVQEPIVTPSPVEEPSPIVHSDDLESIKKSIYELEKDLRCLKQEINQLKSAPVHKTS